MPWSDVGGDPTGACSNIVRHAEWYSVCIAPTYLLGLYKLSTILNCCNDISEKLTNLLRHFFSLIFRASLYSASCRLIIFIYGDARYPAGFFPPLRSDVFSQCSLNLFEHCILTWTHQNTWAWTCTSVSTVNSTGNHKYNQEFQLSERLMRYLAVQATNPVNHT